MRVGEPVLLRDHVHDEPAQRAPRPTSPRWRGEGFQSVFAGLVVVQAGDHTVDVLHDQVGLYRMQAAAGRAGLLQEYGVVADSHLGLRGEHAVSVRRMVLH